MWSKDHNLIKALVTNDLLQNLIEKIDLCDNDDLADDTEIVESLIHLKDYIGEIVE